MVGGMALSKELKSKIDKGFQVYLLNHPRQRKKKLVIRTGTMLDLFNLIYSNFTALSSVIGF